MYKRLLIAILIFLSLGGTAQTRKTTTNQPLLTATKQLAWWFKYWTPSDAKAPLVTLIIQRQICGIADAETYLEMVATDLKSRQIVFQAFYDLTQGDRNYLFLNLKAIGLTAVNASTITNYIIENYSPQATMTEKEKEEQRQKEMKKEEEQKQLDLITSKHYDFADIEDGYNSIFKALKVKLRERLDLDYVPDFPSLKSITNQFTLLNSNYQQLSISDQHEVDDLKKKFKANYFFKSNYDYHLEEELTDEYIGNSNHSVTLNKGSDEKLALFKDLVIGLPKLSISVDFPTLGIYTVYARNKSVTIKNIDVNLARGITIIKVKKGAVTYVKYPPSDDIQKIILDKVDKSSKSSFVVTYECGNFLDNSVNNITLEKIEGGWKGVARALGIEL